LNLEAKLNLELYNKKKSKKFRSRNNENDVLIILRCSREDGDEGEITLQVRCEGGYARVSQANELGGGAKCDFILGC
jgi:hypothetical protein